MKKLLQLLQAKGLKWDFTQVEDFVKSQGYEGDLSDEAIIKLADIAIKKSAITATNTGKPTTKKRKPQNTFDSALTKLAKATGQELDAMVMEVEAGAEYASNTAGERMYGAIANIPQGAVNHFAQLADNHQGDVEGFRQIGREIAQSLSGFSSSNVA